MLTKFKDVIDKKADIHEVHDLIEQLESLMQSSEDEVRYEDYYILALCVAFRDDNLAKERGRNMSINGSIESKIFILEIVM